MVRAKLIILSLLISAQVSAQFSDCEKAVEVNKPYYLQPIARDAGETCHGVSQSHAVLEKPVMQSPNRKQIITFAYINCKK